MEGLARIRRLGPADLDAVVAIQALSPETSQWSREDYASALLAAGPVGSNVVALVAETSSRIVGFAVARCAADQCEVLNLAVAPEVRRQGVGSELLRHALEAPEMAEVHSIFLEVRASNRAAIAFYGGHGFGVVGRRPRYYQNPPEDALVLSRRLPGKG